MRYPAVLRLCATALLLSAAAAAGAAEILFIGNSFTQGVGSPVREWGAGSVRDLEERGIGGLPALVQAFFKQVGEEHRLSLSTEGGKGLDWHLAQRADRLAAGHWDVVVLQTFSTLDRAHPGDPALLVRSTPALVARLRERSPQAQFWLMATWARADQVVPAAGAWHGKGLEAMTRDLRAGNDAAARATPEVRGVIPVGEAWWRAIRAGIADPDPYDGTSPGQLDLWAADHYHASAAGSYLEALVVFGRLSGRDPALLGAQEPVARALGLSSAQAGALQRVASETLAAEPLPAPAASAIPATAPAH